MYRHKALCNIHYETMKHKQFAHKNVKYSLMHTPESELIVIVSSHKEITILCTENEKN